MKTVYKFYRIRYTYKIRFTLSGEAHPPEGNELRYALQGIPYRAKPAIPKGVSCGMPFRV